MKWYVLGGVILLVASLSQAALATDVYNVEFLVATTSDWTHVTLDRATLAVHSYEILEGGGAPGLDIRALSNIKVHKRKYDETPVTIRARAYVTDLDPELIGITVSKGFIGETTVELRAMQGSRSIPLASYTHAGVVDDSDPQNPRVFNLLSQEISRCASTLELPPPREAMFGGRKAFAFYYPWYGTPEGASGRWFHWNPRAAHRDSTHVPAAGYYDSQDPETVRRQIREAKEAGIDGFIASWWGVGTFEDEALGVLIDVASDEDFLISVYYEQAGSVDQIVDDVAYLLDRFGSSPAFLRVGAVPVVFFYVRVVASFDLSEWGIVFQRLEDMGTSLFAVADGLQGDLLGVFQGIHTYNPVAQNLDTIAQQYTAGSLLARLDGALFAATVVPGFDDTNIRHPSLVVDREDGDTYRAFWEAARASDPHWILITSFNEWHEGSEIEPSIEFGRDYLSLTAEQAEQWRTSPGQAKRPPPTEYLCLYGRPDHVQAERCVALSGAIPHRYMESMNYDCSGAAGRDDPASSDV